jgi:hypothetical protein
MLVVLSSDKLEKEQVLCFYCHAEVQIAIMPRLFAYGLELTSEFMSVLDVTSGSKKEWYMKTSIDRNLSLFPFFLLYLHERHLVLHAAQLFNLYLDHIAVFEPFGRRHTHCHTCRSSSHDDSAFLQSCSLADELDDTLHVEKQVVCIGVLPYFAVERGIVNKIRRS